MEKVGKTDLPTLTLRVIHLRFWRIINSIEPFKYLGKFKNKAWIVPGPLPFATCPVKAYYDSLNTQKQKSFDFFIEAIKNSYTVK
ncbi:MAG: hypothetical protein KC643_26655 [Nitrospira sp.]|nr:hypothetical protein [Nitrospira sp.]